jgi:histone deacetylase HOS3
MFAHPLTIDQATSRSTTPKPELPSYTQPTKQSSRRLSAASTAGSVISEAPPSRPNGHSRVPSTGPMPNPPRPGSSQSIRPDSSMSSRGHSIPPVVMKKTRAPAQSRAEPAKPRVRRKSPLNDTGVARTGNDGSLDPPSRSGSVSLPPHPPGSTQNADIDNLTSGMKKISISLVTKVCNFKDYLDCTMSKWLSLTCDSIFSFVERSLTTRL